MLIFGTNFLIKWKNWSGSSLIRFDINKTCKHKLMNMGIRRRRAVFRGLRAGVFFGRHSGARQGKDARTVGTIRGGKDAFTVGVKT